MNTKLLYTSQEVAEMMSISRSQVYNLMNDNKLKSVHIGRCRRITADQINEFINQLTLNNKDKVEKTINDEGEENG